MGIAVNIKIKYIDRKWPIWVKYFFENTRISNTCSKYFIVSKSILIVFWIFQKKANILCSNSIII